MITSTGITYDILLYKSIKIFDNSLDEYLTETTHGLWVLLTRRHNVTAVSALSSSSLGLEPHSEE